MKLYKTLFALLAVAALSFGVSARAADTKAAGQKSAAELEKEKALANPYPNDFGPETLDDATLKSYPANIQEGYKLLRGSAAKKNCQSCHTSSRPLNSRFVELEGKTDAEREAKVAKLKKEHPEYFSNPAVWQIESKVWNRYVKRMMSKPGCNIDGPTGKKIWQFLVYDSEHRKIGANAEKWKAHRMELVEKLKAQKPARYDELKKDNDL